MLLWCAATKMISTAVPPQHQRRFRGPWLLLGLLLAGGAETRAVPPQVDFCRDVRPILAEHCFACHGPDAAARQAGLRLDRRDDALAAGAILPGQPQQSPLVRRIDAEVAEEVMPPPSTHKQLIPSQRAILHGWIEQGAPYQTHWSLVPPRRPEVPPVARAAWPRNPIDSFVLAALEAKGLAPAPEAERNTLLRRVSLDLTGLPPSPATVAAFVADPAPDAYERLVDRLMASPDYAERRAQDWLDLARYADTRGYADDKPDHHWPYRDWVVAAIARNQPFDQFTIEQLAGDMLPGATPAQQIATMFHRLAPQAKGETYPVEEYRLKGVVDRVNTTGGVWLGLTVACAECHDHKFDPLSQVEYFRLLALFNSIEHGGQGFQQGGPTMPWETPGGEKLDLPVMRELPQPRETFVHLRGDFLMPGERVTPGVPEIFGTPPENQPTNRLELARWLVSGRHPLVARVTVNRLWQAAFGAGLVRTPADFGLRGEWPSHPELLDWLACEFVDSGWNMQALHRLIVTSATYRQTARPPEATARIDPDNRLLGWMPRVRLPAEQIRDQALAMADLIQPSVGGPSIFPPQPEGYWEDRDLPGTWQTSSSEESHRKSLYVYWRRMALHPTLELLDAPARLVCTVQRSTANLPTQALVTLNDPVFVEAAQAFAARILREAPHDDSARLNHSFALALSRPPTAREREQVLRFIVASRVSANENDEHRVWSGVATVLLNLDETLMRP